MGGIEFELKNPAKMFPIAKQLVEFTSMGLFSLIKGEKLYHGVPNRAKNKIRALYTAVRDVVIIVRARAQALAYDLVVASMIKSFE